MRTPLHMLMALAMLAGLAACETGKGFIQDSENVGQAVANELDD